MVEHILLMVECVSVFCTTFALVIKTQHRGVEQLVARWAHNPKVVCSSQASATSIKEKQNCFSFLFPQYFFISYL